MMLPELLSSIFNIEKRPMDKENNSAKTPEESGLDSADKGVVSPDQMMRDKVLKGIIGDDGNFSLDQTPFKGIADMLKNSRANGDTGPGVLKQLLSSVLGGGIVPGTGTVGGDPAGVSGPTHTPGTRQDAALNPTPLAKQKMPGLTPSIPLPQQRPDYSQPTALDPVAIEQLRLSLLSDSGQLDPNNPNGLAGRMTGPNSQVDMNNQRKEAMSIGDSVRGFDGSKKANIAKRNQS